MRANSTTWKLLDIRAYHNVINDAKHCSIILQVNKNILYEKVGGI